MSDVEVDRVRVRVGGQSENSPVRFRPINFDEAIRKVENEVRIRL